MKRCNADRSYASRNAGLVASSTNGVVTVVRYHCVLHQNRRKRRQKPARALEIPTFFKI